MTDFLLELRSEEIPARMQAGARAELEKLFRREMASAGIDVTDVSIWSTPRRLALIACGLPDATQAVSEEAKGPPEGAPDPALEGFCRKNGVRVDQLQLRDVKGRQTWFAVIDKPGRATKAVLADAIPAIIRDFAWPKSMRWGAASISTTSPRWVRPLSGIVAIFGDELVECEAAGVRSGYATLGHRFHTGVSHEKVGTGFSGRDATHKYSGEITIGGAHDYAEKLRACHVIVDHRERAALIREGAAKAAADAGLTLVEDEGLVTENAGLTEWPVPLLGRFDEAFLDVPPEVIQLTARVNQKYFVCTSSPSSRDGEGDRSAKPSGGGGGGETAAGAAAPPSDADASATSPSQVDGEALRLANAFICTANLASSEPAAIIDGNRKVLAARLSDARFFWEQDRKKTLAQHAEGLARITFHEKLGTVADKVERVAKLARWLVEEGIVTETPLPGGEGTGVGVPTSQASNTYPQPLPSREGASLADFAEQAARLCKADLVTEMVGEFPELQGLMGGYYARAEDLPAEVADAIRDHYKPVGQGDEVPNAPVTVAVSLADKLDTLFSFFEIGELPTGSKDPFALRRAAIAVIRLIESNGLRVLVSEIARKWNVYETVGPGLQVEDFLHDRLGVMMRDDGVRYDIVQASTELGARLDGDVWRVRRRAAELQSFIGTEDGANLHAAYKRAANILKKEGVVPAKAGTAIGQGATSQAIPASAGMTDQNTNNDIPQTGEEDPLAMVDDPDLKAVIDAKMTERHAKEKSLSYTPEPAERALIAALDSAEPRAARAVATEDFEAAMSALASLRGPIDRFFDEVTVNDENPAKRAARLDLLARFRDAVHSVADFSRIEG